MANILFLDNFDSFTYNLVDQFRVLGHQVKIYRNDCDLEQLIETALNTPETILALSPGPGTPTEAGILLPLIERLKDKIPIIGICLGHQALIQAFGGKVIHAGEVLHGKVSKITHDERAMFKDIVNPMPVARYHSLMGQDLPQEFVINAEYNGIIMAIRHRELPICSFQFHPESILTVQGAQLLQQSIEWLLNH
ncbi:aminodeoxychorismate/anthranilate synthase component II [Rodentibacter pneumotropicus]|uniref:aminodeoxychorismate/anthranilate synthase component II n=1 Tax=Rodentibacter pneumotropicus TaxID=758 RepID=UPI0003812F53|nr:aminodeoxychorismate/anthranilate synthase component II [Rodentibacter pneumotropicus]MDC2824773.1 aminodeoxychorismate/anthranilate synthase component II [Rodentibacter pneumotropicus]NBH74790.1 aminodeoxychorismate/anthranilate synthase component II [Rodentibacter pneumotropicus]OOF62797.1 anthranilate synthase component II [Rodentibacter pneumotropicus]THA03380.1 aminodeoxychorismate/anthranilate synthase component II [Rodentibacter pneumotropicus]THA04594.1 aminodeoxychorismate/anthrani